jgi:nucleoside-diphosphate-sugar epimerase
MKIAIFGGTGFVGSNVVKYLKNYQLDVFKRIDRNFSLQSFDKDTFAVLNFVGIAHEFNSKFTAEDYNSINNIFCNRLYDNFVNSSAEVFITISSVKAVADELNEVLTENFQPSPSTIYGKSKLSAENYILSKKLPIGKRVYILRPCMIHGPGNKGNLNLIFEIINSGYPWPLGKFDNSRSFCNVENLCFVINELILDKKIPSGIYNIADDESISTNEIIRIIALCLNKKPTILNIPILLIVIASKIGDYLNLPLNTIRLKKLTENYIVSNAKIKSAINKPLPISARLGLINTFSHFINNKIGNI